jgi:hypothetical protein
MMEELRKLAGMNIRQTKRCVRYLRGVRLLEEVYTEAELAMGDEQSFMISAETVDRIGAYLADFSAIEEADRFAGLDGAVS